MSESMNMPSLPANGYPASQPLQQDLSLKQMAMDSRQTEISMTTSEGDRVTISLALENLQALDYFASGGNQQINFLTARLSSTAFSMTVEGDLNEQELADIQSLIKDLSHISKDFFKGHMKQAMTKAMEIGDTGTINSFSAAFTSTKTTMSQLTENHPIPALSQETMASEATNGELVDVAHDTPDFMDLLRGQWAQIEQLLEQQPAPTYEAPLLSPQEMPATLADAATPTETAQAMMDRAITTMADNPRLSPFTLPLADRVIEDTFAFMPKSPGIQSLANQLHNEFARNFHYWLTAA
jgi:hypothetical protein